MLTIENKFGTVEYFEGYLERAMTQEGEKHSHNDLYRITFSLFDLICEGEFSPNKKEQLEQLKNLRKASDKVSIRLTKWGEEVI